MTQLCYTLEETAARLNLSETVLVRLSQYFKVPRSAYEEVGYLSFKGDLAFTDQDIAFFRQVKERLLAGETLEDVKNRIRPEQVVAVTPQPVAASRPHLQVVPDRPAPQAANIITPNPQPLLSAAQPLDPMPEMRELQDPNAMATMSKVAEKNFERYKSKHRTGLGKVFENMLKEVGTPSPKKRSAQPAAKPLREKVAQDSGKPQKQEKARSSEAILPFRPTRKAEPERAPQAPRTAQKSNDTQRPQMAISGIWNRQPATPPEEAAWDSIIKQAVSHPRVLNSHLKNAAALIRDRAMAEENSPPSETGMADLS